MSEWKWIDRSHPQTLQSAVLLCYASAAIGVLSSLVWNAPPWFYLTLLLTIPAYFIANEKLAGYYGAIVLSFLLLLVQAAYFFDGYFVVILSMLFTVALIALLLHPQSREYVRIWFPTTKRQPPRRW